MSMTTTGGRFGAAALCVLFSFSTACNGDDAVPSDDTDSTSTGAGTADGPFTTDTPPSTGMVDTTAGDDDDDDDSTTDTGETDTTDTGGDPPEVPDVPGETISCDNDIPAAPAGQVCDVTPGNGTLLIQGTVLAGWDVYEAGTVLVDTSEPNGRILCTGCDCADEPEAAGATVIACADGVVSPGLINAHDHITFTLSQPVPHGMERYDHRHEWRLGLNGATELDTFPGSDSSREGVLFGEVRMLLGGATSVTGSVGSASAQNLARNLDRADVTGGLQGVDVNYRTFPLGDTDGTMLTMSCSYPFIDGPFNLNDDIYMPHIAEGIGAAAQNEFECMSGGSGGEELIASNTSVVHGIGMTAEDIDEMREVGAMLIWSPRSNVDLYGITADLPLYRTLGVRFALGTDWTASGSMNVLRELQCADSFNTDHLSGLLSDSELWMMSTHWAAASQGAADQLGLLAPGYVGDITIFDGSRATAHRAVIEADVTDVALVLRGGQPLHGDAPVIEGLVPVAEVDQCESLDVCGTDKRLCIQRDAGMTLAALTAGVHPEAYDLFFCGEPDTEPSCDPARPDEFPNRGGPDDLDGDGVEDDEDNCPDLFNPIRPLDEGIQADTDQDGIGDTCDLCPLDPGDTCMVPDVYDQDGDGVADPDDNCILDDNPDQEDADEDGQGDACDLCPTVSNPGGSPCPTTIYEIKDGTIDFGSNVFVPSALVTGIGGNGYFLQVHPDDMGYQGVDYSGVFVYDPGLPMTLAVGDYVSVTGQVQDFFGQTQLVASDDPIVLSSGNPPPPPEPTMVADIIEGGPDQEALEGVVVELQNLTVTDVMPMAGPGDDASGEFEVEGGLRINDFFYLADPFPMVDQQYARVAGVARWANDFTKLEPRGLEDYPASLIAFGSPESFLLEGRDGRAPAGAAGRAVVDGRRRDHRQSHLPGRRSRDGSAVRGRPDRLVDGARRAHRCLPGYGRRHRRARRRDADDLGAGLRRRGAAHPHPVAGDGQRHPGQHAHDDGGPRSAGARRRSERGHLGHARDVPHRAGDRGRPGVRAVRSVRRDGARLHGRRGRHGHDRTGDVELDDLGGGRARVPRPHHRGGLLRPHRRRRRLRVGQDLQRHRRAGGSVGLQPRLGRHRLHLRWPRSRRQPRRGRVLRDRWSDG